MYKHSIMGWQYPIILITFHIVLTQINITYTSVDLQTLHIVLTLYHRSVP